MKRYAWLVVYSAPAALGGLLLGAIFSGLGFGLFGLLSPDTGFSHFAVGWSFGLFMAMFALMIGVLPVLLYGAPAYALTMYFSRASYFTATVLGFVPGLVLLAFGSSYGGMFLMFGAPVAWCTHYLAKRSPRLQQLGANNSFKPTPLRGAA